MKCAGLVIKEDKVWCKHNVNTFVNVNTTYFRVLVSRVVRLLGQKGSESEGIEGSEGVEGVEGGAVKPVVTTRDATKQRDVTTRRVLHRHGSTTTPFISSRWYETHQTSPTKRDVQLLISPHLHFDFSTFRLFTKLWQNDNFQCFRFCFPWAYVNIARQLCLGSCGQWQQRTSFESEPKVTKQYKTHVFFFEDLKKVKVDPQNPTDTGRRSLCTWSAALPSTTRHGLQSFNVEKPSWWR